jgi:hypothetical protein
MVVMAAMLAISSAAGAQGTQVPGHAKKSDKDGNGYPDAGIVVNGHYTSVYAYDANGDSYWDLGDGRIQGSVGSIDALDQSTLTVCDYIVNYRGSFENDPFQDTGWIKNNIHCHGYDGNATFNSIYVSQSDPRYTGTGPAIWGTWEVHVDTQSGAGNQVRPENHVGG